jgi:hypothetical protein
MNKYCGPAVLSILTGRNSDECAAVISRISGQYTVIGVAPDVLLKALNKLGFDSRHVATVEGASLYRTLIQLVLVDGMYILWIGNHYVVVEIVNKRIFFCDNHTKEPIPAESSARLSMKVINCWHVTKRVELPIPPEPKLINTDFDIVLTDSGMFVDKVLYYDNDTSKKEMIGSIKTKDYNELCYILDLIDEKRQETVKV